MSDRDKKWIQYALLVAAVVILGYLGIRYPMPEMPEFVPPDVEMQAVGPTRGPPPRVWGEFLPGAPARRARRSTPTRVGRMCFF